MTIHNHIGSNIAAVNYYDGGLFIEAQWSGTASETHEHKRLYGQIEITDKKEVIALARWLQQVYLTPVDGVGQRPAAETAAEVTPQQTTPESQKAAG